MKKILLLLGMICILLTGCSDDASQKKEEDSFVEEITIVPITVKEIEIRP